MEKTTTEHTDGETTMNDSESIAESFTKTTVCENDNLEMIGQCHMICSHPHEGLDPKSIAVVISAGAKKIL
jgi:hypothetical protein